MNNELYHYGVPGMKWGHRKGNLKTAYKNVKYNKKLKAENKQLIKEFKKDSSLAYKLGIPGSRQDNQMGGAGTKHYYDMIKRKGKEYADKAIKRAGSIRLLDTVIRYNGDLLTMKVANNQTKREIRNMNKK